MQKKSHSDIEFLLQFFLKKRESLISSFLEKDSEYIISPTFRYERNPSAFDLVRDRFFTLWIDKHLEELINASCPDKLKDKAFSCISELLYSQHDNVDSSKIKHELLHTKIKVIEELLNHEDHNQAKLNEFKFAYDKDKALFERAFEKFAQEATSENN